MSDTIKFNGMLWDLDMLDREIVKYRSYKATAMLDRRMPLEGYANHLDGLLVARHQLVSI